MDTLPLGWKWTSYILQKGLNHILLTEMVEKALMQGMLQHL